jgi:hypothetical protein
MISNAIGRTNTRLGVVLRAARKATGTASTIASTVPSVATLMVSHSGFHTVRLYIPSVAAAPG